MKISLGKKIAILTMIFIYGMAMLAMNLTDNLKVTRAELTRFYSTKMDSCIITQIDTINYAGGRGTYQIFHTDCDADFYPVLFEDGNRADFNINSMIIKEANSIEFRLLSSDTFQDSKMRHPDNEDDRSFGTKVASIFLCIAIILILLASNSKFEKTGQ
jgi:hypothetical protein